MKNVLLFELKKFVDELKSIKVIEVNSCDEMSEKWEEPTNLMREIMNNFDCIIDSPSATDVDKITANELQQDALDYYIENFNPWAVYAKNYRANTQNPRFILNDHDADIIDRHNIKHVGTDREIKTKDLLPTPFVGNLKTARFVMLLKNPGLDSEDEKRIKQPQWEQTILSNLMSPKSCDANFVFLSPSYQNLVCNPKDVGQKWWNTNIKNVKNGLNQASAFCGPVHTWVADIELVPYASKTFGKVDDKYNIALIKGLFSWFFTSCLIRYVMGRGVPIYIRSGMTDFIPELSQYKTGGRHPYSGRLFTNLNMLYVSAGNVKQVNSNEKTQDSFDKLIAQIKSVK